MKDDKVEEELCYCCLNKTNNRSPCQCKAYICKSCLKKYMNFETECKICKRPFVIEEPFCKKIYHNIKKYLSTINWDYICVILLVNPISVLFYISILISGFLFIPPIIYCIIKALFFEKPIIFILTINTWLIGFFMLLVLTCCSFCTIFSFSILIKFLINMF